MEGIQTLKVSWPWPWPSIRHVVLHQSSISSYIPNFIQIEETFCGRTDVRTYGWTDIFPLYIIRSTLGSRPKKANYYPTNATPVPTCILSDTESAMIVCIFLSRNRYLHRAATNRSKICMMVELCLLCSFSPFGGDILRVSKCGSRKGFR